MIFDKNGPGQVCHAWTRRADLFDDVPRGILGKLTHKPVAVRGENWFQRDAGRNACDEGDRLAKSAERK